MTTQGTRDEYNRKFISGPHSTRDSRLIAKKLQDLFPLFYFEDEERNVWANSPGVMILRATEIVADPYGPTATDGAQKIAQRILRSKMTAWSAAATAGCIAKSYSTAVLMSLCDSMGTETAASHLASEALQQLAKTWYGQ